MARGYSSCSFVGDWFRCILAGGRVGISQAGNVAWLSRLLAPAIGIAPNALRVIMPSSDMSTFTRQIGSTALMQEYLSDWPSAWARYFDGELPQGCFSELFDQLDADGLVVGFEIPPVMRRILARRGIDYLSFHNHPMRFLKDLAFGAYSNSSAVVASLSAISCEPREVERQVARFSARFARLDPVQARLPEGCPVLFGQTDEDASLIAGGRFVGWRDYVDAIADALDGHAVVACVRHPQARWRREVIELLRSDLGKTVVAVSGNSYPLIMSARALGPILTISSSIGVEAEAFGYGVRFLLADPRTKFAVAGLDNQEQVLLDHRLFENELWTQILTGSGEGADAHQEAFYLGRDFVRGTLESWAFAAIEGATPFVSMEKIIVPAVGTTADQLDDLAGILAGTGDGNREGATAEARRNDIVLGFSSPPLVAGGTWRWGGQENLSELAVVEGFFPIEEDGAWSQGCEATIEIPVGGAVGEELQIDGELAFSFFRGTLGERPALLLYVNGLPCSAMLCMKTDEAYHQLPFSAVIAAGKPCQLRIECSHAASPAEMGMGDDDRVLGLILHEIGLSARGADWHRDGCALRLWGVGNRPIDISCLEE